MKAEKTKQLETINRLLDELLTIYAHAIINLDGKKANWCAEIKNMLIEKKVKLEMEMEVMNGN